MSNVQIPNLPASVALNGNEQLEAVQAGTSVRVTTDQIATYTQAQYPAPGVSSIATTAPITGGTITTTGTIGLQAAGVDNSYLASMAGGTVKANVTGSPAQPSDASVSSVLDVVGSTRGTVLYRGVSNWSPLLPGSPNDILSSGGAGADPSWQSISATLDTASGSTQGSILYRDASTWTELPPGTSGQVLRTNGGGADPSWATISGAGTVTQINTGTGLTGGPITISGTISIANTGVAAGSYGTTSAVPALAVNAQGQITSATDTAIAIATSQITSGTLGIDRGGTGLSSVPTNGQIDIGNGTGFTRTTLTASTGISISNGAGSISIGNSGVLSFSAGTTGLTPSTGTTGTVTLAGTLNVANGGTGATSLTGYVYGNGTGAFTASTTIPNSGLQNSSLTIGSTAISLGNTASSIAGLTSLTLTQDPINPLDAATKQYVDSTIEGLNIHAPAAAATTANLTATYNNGTSGVGATLTNSGTQAAFAVDGYTAALNDRILVKDQSTAAQNGVYTVTTVGSGSTNWVLTRATDMNVSGSGADQLGPGDYVFVVNGTQNARTAWVVTTPLPITIGSTSITFVQFAGAGTYTAGTGLTLTGTQFSITNTGVSAASYGSASSVPAIAINAQGQITSATDTAIAISASQITSGSLGVARGGTGASSLTANGILYGNGTSAVGATSAGVTGEVLVGNTGSPPTWATLSSSAVTSFSGGTTGLTPSSATQGAITLAGTLAAANGGTGTSTTFTAGSVLFAGASGVYAQDNANLFWDDTNNTLGIGMSSPGATRLYISTNRATNPTLQAWDTFNGATFENTALLSYDGTKTFFYNFQANPLAFGTNNAERLRIDASGNVGIGTSSPATALHVLGNITTGGNQSGKYLARNGADVSVMDFGVATGTGFGDSIGLYNLTSTGLLTFGTNNTERMRIDSSGNVGIGTSSPGTKLQVNGNLTLGDAIITGTGTSTGDTNIELGGNRTGSGNSFIDFHSTASTDFESRIIRSSGANGTFQLQNTGTGDFYLLQGGAAPILFLTSGTERLRIASAGQIGIGGANYGTAGQVLTSNGSGAAPSWQTGGGTGTLKNVQVFTSSGTYTRTAGVTTAVVIAVGGGGGGKGVNGPAAQPGGNGGAGGTTSFGAHVSAAGGSGATGSTGAAGGTGGTGANIAIKGAPSPKNAGGGQGGGTPVDNAAGVAGVRGGGGSGGSFLDGCFNFYEGGGGGQGETAIKYTTTVGATETVTIGAGGTAGTSNVSRAGGAGGAGYIIVYEYS